MHRKLEFQTLFSGTMKKAISIRSTELLLIFLELLALPVSRSLRLGHFYVVSRDPVSVSDAHEGFSFQIQDHSCVYERMRVWMRKNQMKIIKAKNNDEYNVSRLRKFSYPRLLY